MIPYKFKVLTYGPAFVNVSMLHRGVYAAIVPLIYKGETTVESMCNDVQAMASELDLTPDSFIENIKKCSLTTCAIVTEETTAYLMDIAGEATVVLARNISEAMDKAAAVAKKEYKMVYSKSLPLLF